MRLAVAIRWNRQYRQQCRVCLWWTPTEWGEQLARACTIQIGCVACYAVAPMSAYQVRATAVLNTLSLARDLRDAVKRAQQDSTNSIEAILNACPGQVLFSGKIVDLERHTTEGWVRGRVYLEGLGEDSGDVMAIDFQNENLVARRNDEIGGTVA